MVRISGFFCSHGVFSFNTIAPTIEEVRATFSHEGNNILIKESFPENPIEEVILEHQKFAQEVFTRSATEKNLLGLMLECQQKTQDERFRIRSLNDEQIRKDVLAFNDCFSILMLELSELRKTINFQLLIESGTTPEVNSLVKCYRSVQKKLISSWGGFDAFVNALAEGEEYLLKIGLIREGLIRQKIDGLMAQHPKLNIHVIFGSGHKNMLEPYRKCEDISLREIVLSEPGISFMTAIGDSMMAGNVITAEEKLALYLWKCLEDFVNGIIREFGIIVHCGDLFEILHPLLSTSQLKSFFCGDEKEGLIRMTKLLKEIGALDVLNNRNPKAGNSLRTLANAPIGSITSGRTLRQTPGRNSPCPCGSGKKYKKCCGK